MHNVFLMNISGEMSTGKQKTIDDYFCCPSRKQPRPEDSAIPAATSEDLPMIVETASHSALQTENIDEEPDISMPWNDFSEENSPTTSSINQPVAGNAAQTADLLDVGRLLSAYGPTPTNIPDDLKMKLLKVKDRNMWIWSFENFDL